MLEDDPRTWPLPLPYRRLYLGDSMDARYCIIDVVDYDWAMQWKWRAAVSQHGKVYATRFSSRKEPPRRTVYLHKEILLRKEGERPSLFHHIGDHLNGDSLNNRRINLDWQTPVGNRHNRRPAHLLGIDPDRNAALAKYRAKRGLQLFD